MSGIGIRRPQADGNSLARGDDTADGVAAGKHNATMIHGCRGCIGRVQIEAGPGDESASAGWAGGEITDWFNRCVAIPADLVHLSRLHGALKVRSTGARLGMLPMAVWRRSAAWQKNWLMRGKSMSQGLKPR